jgi:hypothetical protein
MFMMTIVLSKIQYTMSLFQILMGSIGMSKQGGIWLLATISYSVFKAQFSPQGQLYLWQMWFPRLSLWSRKHRTKRIPKFHFFISLHQHLLISTILLMKMSWCLWVLTWILLAHFSPYVWMCTMWRTCLQIWIRFRVETSKP